MLRMPGDTDVAQTAVAEYEAAMRDFGHWMDRSVEFTDKRYGIGIVDRSCIEMLVDRPEGCRAGEIAEYLHLSVGEASALVSRLVRRGFARRERDSADPEMVTVHAVADSGDVMAIVNARRAVLAGVTQHFDPEELAVVARYAAYMMTLHPARLAEDAERLAARKLLVEADRAATPARTPATAKPER